MSSPRPIIKGLILVSLFFNWIAGKYHYDLSIRHSSEGWNTQRADPLLLVKILFIMTRFLPTQE